MKKFLIALASLPILTTTSAFAAAVGGEDNWQDLTPTELSEPIDFAGKIRLSRNIFHGPEYYPTTFGETKTTAEAQLDLKLRLTQNWQIKSRLEASRIWKDYQADNHLEAEQLYLAGKVGNVNLQAGKLPVFDALNLTSGGLVIDAPITGGEIDTKIGCWRISFAGGVIDNDDYSLTRTTTIFNTNSTYLGLSATGSILKNCQAFIAVHNMHNTAGGLVLPSGAYYSPDGNGFFESGTEKNNTIFEVGADYKLSDLTFGAMYSVGSAKITKQAQILSHESPAEDNSFSVQLTYGQPELQKTHNTALWLAYRKLGRTGSYNPAYKGVGFGEQGIELGVRHNLLDDLALQVVYFAGRKISKITSPANSAELPHIHKWYLGLSYDF